MRFNKAQSLAEYALLATIVIAALVGMQVYVKRGLQGRVKTFVDGATSGVSSLAALEKPLQQYEPYYINSDITTDAKQKVTTTHSPGGSLRYDYDAEGNVVERQGRVIVKGTSEEDLKQDDDWEK